MMLSSEQAQEDVAHVLYMAVDELDHGLDLREQGMDSVRVMQLVEQWRTAGVEKVDYIVLAEDPRLERWLEVLADLQQPAESV
ncbi:phosphopantetheine-binding protein [Rhodococcus sp. P1Y]|uniref:phosphopantetheine-binding protein n=1 Tax=Rhodococcus sp. P1Y TaxID=1302308 RepID=UPI000EB49A2A|nr:phosphopantetheine-binding protein [Rhodococcus sp. P1Y]AYJ48486.1 acyl carrier protein [Rhodococcus sp. P1Y]